MSERETTTITTPGGHKVVLNAYLTGRESRDIKDVLFGAIKMSMADAQSGKVELGDVSAAFLADQEKAAIGYLLISIDDITDKALDTLLDLPSTEYDAVVAQVNKITNPTMPEKSGQPGAATSQTA